ncbi:MAG: hypothetical protein HYS07_05350 [Chlamydiae bacterium]|nr:hypothetical protein [Chlamydiota bacterium]MBI3278013.1 hypothetical protein [Chlamydiota bacterium]
MEIDYEARSGVTNYPESVSLEVARPGRLNLVVWQQDLIFDDILIRSTESLNWVTPATSVEPQDKTILSTGSEWIQSIPMQVKKHSRKI